MESQTKKSKYEIDMCNGTIMDKLDFFSLPLMLSGILQLMFNAVDIIVVGRFSGSQSLAAVGSDNSIDQYVYQSFIGISLGANVPQHVFMRQSEKRRCQRQYIPQLHWH